MTSIIEKGEYTLQYPVTFISGSELTFFGGYRQYSHSIEQRFDLDNIASTTKISSADTVFKDLISSTGLGIEIECFKCKTHNIF